MAKDLIQYVLLIRHRPCEYGVLITSYYVAE
jgi:hypothetical protein